MGCIERLRHPITSLQDTINQIRQSPNIHQKVLIVALVILTNVLVRINPIICSVTLVASFFGGREIYLFLQNHFLNDLKRNPCITSTVIGILGFAAPHFAIFATSTIYCSWAGSRFKMYLRNEV